MLKEEQNDGSHKTSLLETTLHEIEIMERIYDCETDDHGNKKPNKSLGKFLMSDEWKRRFLENCNKCNTYGIKDNEIYEISSKQISGFYNREIGGIKFSAMKLSEHEMIRTWEWFYNHFY